MSLFYRIYEQLPRQGPGDAESTKRALAVVPDLGRTPHVLDIGCGSGKQTIDLASAMDGEITAVDNHQPFLDTLLRDAYENGVSDRIRCECMDMANMTFAPSSFDLIWSEGAIFILGFKEGLLQWRSFLRPHGVMVVSEIAWLKPNPPAELIEFWGTECPDMGNAEVHLSLLRRCGYQVLDHFVLPEQAWWSDYYEPLDQVLAEMRLVYRNDAEAIELFETLQTEIEMYRKYSDFYGYVFYVMQRTD